MTTLEFFVTKCPFPKVFQKFKGAVEVNDNEGSRILKFELKEGKLSNFIYRSKKYNESGAGYQLSDISFDEYFKNTVFEAFDIPQGFDDEDVKSWIEASLKIEYRKMV